MLTNLLVLYDFCIGNPISCLLTVGSKPIQHSVLNVKAVVAAFNQERDLIRDYTTSNFAKVRVKL